MMSQNLNYPHLPPLYPHLAPQGAGDGLYPKDLPPHPHLLGGAGVRGGRPIDVSTETNRGEKFPPTSFSQ